MSYQRARLQRLLSMAEQLGFAEEIAHWKEELRKLDKAEGVGHNA